MNSRSGTAPTSTPKRILSRFRDKPTSRRVTRQLHVAQGSCLRVRPQCIKCRSRQRRSFGVLDCTSREHMKTPRVDEYWARITPLRHWTLVW